MATQSALNAAAILKDIYQVAVVEGNKDYNGNIPEYIFVGYFLPYFRERIENPEELTEEKRAYRKQVLEDWIKVAGTFFNEVNVLNNTGNVLFVVPALVNSEIFNPVRKEDSKPFGEIAAMGELYNQLSPAKSQEMTNASLDKRLKEMADGKHKFLPNEVRWKEIFKRYSGDDDVKESEQEQSKGSGALTDDDIIYD